MRKNVFSCLMVLLFIGNVFAQDRVLVFSKTAGYRHKSIEVGIKSIQKLGKEHNFIVDATEDAEVMIKKIKKYDAVIFLNTTGDILNEKQQKKFEKYIEKGGGFVGVHAAADTEYEWPWYGNMLGAYFLSHPQQQDALMHIENHEHEATSFLDATWTKFDEWYNYKDISPKINVLMKLDETSYKRGKNGDNHPICWIQDIKKGKMFYTGLGHTDKSYQDEKFLKHLLGGIQSVMK
ncbi:ThuA domain-containing protein [Flavicella sediminum]|uniref:ThuA domain-containing protein n=1 Tax=Flavicella sediminum TaxID=2585141 RepID=UPI00111FCF38|nr:ThuA domain-containing protein [Flavicella sediminum]